MQLPELVGYIYPYVQVEPGIFAEEWGIFVELAKKKITYGTNTRSSPNLAFGSPELVRRQKKVLPIENVI